MEHNDAQNDIEWKYDEATGVARLATRVMIDVHSPEDCAGSSCTIHRRSDHHIRHFPQHFRNYRGLMERICLPETCAGNGGVGHPDPDDPQAASPSDSIHGCCGCCAIKTLDAAKRIVDDSLSPEWLWQKALIEWVLDPETDVEGMAVDINDFRLNDELRGALIQKFGTVEQS